MHSLHRIFDGYLPKTASTAPASEVRYTPPATFRSGRQGGGNNNPGDPGALTPVQKRKTVSFLFEDVSSFTATLAVGRGRGGRNILFAGDSNLVDCSAGAARLNMTSHVLAQGMLPTFSGNATRDEEGDEADEDEMEDEDDEGEDEDEDDEDEDEADYEDEAADEDEARASSGVIR